MTSPEIKEKITPMLAPFINKVKAIGYVAYLGMGRTIPITVAKGIAKSKFFPNKLVIIWSGM
ncbi:unnamed protein product [marine sediment metagenome]|uniref:Uncharacterized protein n=1 Tax=marine sediment metagenome TaxID=412755 RepID=X1L7P6_9ZZZZ